VAWLCAPRWDSGSVFGSLIGARGHYTVTPDERSVWGGYYEDATMIWRSRWPTTSGFVESREALAVPSSTDRLVLLRQARAVDVDAAVRVVLVPAAGYGEHALSDVEQDSDGRWTARVGPLRLRWSGASEATPTEQGWALELTLSAGQRRDLVLEIAEHDLGEPVDPELAWEETETWWRAWSEGIRRRAGAAPRDATHAACVLRGLTSSSGGMVGAATASLPELQQGGDNYDYRYVWVRDQCWAARAAARAGIGSLLDDAVRFLGRRVLDDGADLAPAYTVRGERVPGEERLDVPGYPGGGDRIGNRGGAQFQLDAFGELLLLFAEAAGHDRLDADGWRAAETAVEAIEKRWTEPDAGVWELEDRIWTHSRLICAAGLRQLAEHAAPRLGATWSALADRIVAHVASTSLHVDGRWQRADDDPRHDAALLLPALRGAIPPDDPRSRRTLQTFLDDLTSQGYAYRFRVDERPLGAAEGAFLVCNFITALALHEVGDDLNARHYFERARSACGPPGLFTEEFDVTERQLRGNVPQAFVHALLLECSATLRALESPTDE